MYVKELLQLLQKQLPAPTGKKLKKFIDAIEDYSPEVIISVIIDPKDKEKKHYTTITCRTNAGETIKLVLIRGKKVRITEVKKKDH